MVKVANFIIFFVFLFCAACLDSENAIPFAIGAIVCALYLLGYGVYDNYSRKKQLL